MSKPEASWGKCYDCDETAVYRFREIETPREKKAGKPGKLIGQYCAPHAYASEVDSSPWRIMLPIEPNRYKSLPPVRMLDGRLYEVDAIRTFPPKGSADKPFYLLGPGSLVYRPKLKAWVRKEGSVLVVVSKEPMESGPMGKYFFDAVARLPVSDKGGKLQLVLRADAATAERKSKYSPPTLYHLGLIWVPDPK